jgi:hypothetical protein
MGHEWVTLLLFVSSSKYVGKLLPYPAVCIHRSPHIYYRIQQSVFTDARIFTTVSSSLYSQMPAYLLPYPAVCIHRCPQIYFRIQQSVFTDARISTTVSRSLTDDRIFTTVSSSLYSQMPANLIMYPAVCIHRCPHIYYRIQKSDR